MNRCNRQRKGVVLQNCEAHAWGTLALLFYASIQFRLDAILKLCQMSGFTSQVSFKIMEIEHNLELFVKFELENGSIDK